MVNRGADSGGPHRSTRLGRGEEVRGLSQAPCGQHHILERWVCLMTWLCLFVLLSYWGLSLQWVSIMGVTFL